jgi:succinate dehydrogenase / fumarate reductase cytochrome b subunit
MTTFVSALRSSLGRKYLMGFTGLVWTGFAVGHVIGNFLLFAGRDPFNRYAQFLETLGHGMAIYVAEAFLAVVLMIHVFNGISIVTDKNSARPQGYSSHGNAGGRSRKGLASQNMIWTGLTILGFLILHIVTFKFAHLLGPVPQVTLDGVQRTDLYGVVVSRFSVPWYVGVYTVVMCMLGMHLKHGVWSAFQSLGLLNKKTLPLAVTGATLLAIVLAVGFLALPTTIYLFNPMFAEGAGGIHW